MLTGKDPKPSYYLYFKSLLQRFCLKSPFSCKTSHKLIDYCKKLVVCSFSRVHTCLGANDIMSNENDSQTGHMTGHKGAQRPPAIASPCLPTPFYNHGRTPHTQTCAAIIGL